MTKEENNPMMEIAGSCLRFFCWENTRAGRMMERFTSFTQNESHCILVKIKHNSPVSSIIC